MSFTKIAFGCWNNERNIAVDGQAGKLHALLFDSEELARNHYKRDISMGDVLVLVTCETLDHVGKINE